jgi:hypothetical protein
MLSGHTHIHFRYSNNLYIQVEAGKIENHKNSWTERAIP